MQDEEFSGEETLDTDFAKMLEESFSGRNRLQPGQQLTARILSITGEWIFLDVGRKGEGVLDRRELLDDAGELTVSAGDSVTAWFTGVEQGEMRFTTRVGSGAGGSSQLENAYAAGIPVDCIVEKEVKGGYEVKAGGNSRAFCPFSQIGLRRAADPSSYIGKHLKCIITQYGERGRNIVVSHRRFLEAEQQLQREALKERLQPGQTIAGKVSSLQKFGAFVDIGGIEGLIPMAELAWGKVTDVSEVLQVGQEIEVLVKQIDWDTERITLSLRSEDKDPWLAVKEEFPEGSYKTGIVVKLLPFGAFVAIAPGVEGLIPISRLGSGKRINHPRDVLVEGQEVEVKIEAIEPESRRISLSLAEASRAADEEAESIAQFRKSADTGSGLGTLGDLLQKKLRT